MFRGVIAHVVAFGLGQDLEKCRIAVRYPMAEGKAANEDRDTGQDGIEEIEGPHCTNTNEVEQRALNAQVRERLMQAFEDSICAVLLLRFGWHNFLV